MYVVLFRNHFLRESLVWGGGGGSLELTVSRKMAKKKLAVRRKNCEKINRKLVTTMERH